MSEPSTKPNRTVGKFARLSATDRLIVALDVPNVADAAALIRELDNTVKFYKIGFQLVLAGGLALVRELVEEQKGVFLDMKLLDIDNTVERGVENAARLGVDMLTVHAYPATMRVAAKAASGTKLCVLGVTALTSMDDADLADAGYRFDAAELVARRARQAAAAGIGGVVASAREAREVKNLVGPDMAIVTPGIRPTGAAVRDQKRVMTPAAALSAGATHLVIGRPITDADNRKQAAGAIVREIEAV